MFYQKSLSENSVVHIPYFHGFNDEQRPIEYVSL
jgi:hypothetical protein